MPSQALSTSHHGTLAQRRPISSVTVVQEFSKESIAELADIQSSRMWSRCSTPDPEPLSSFHRRLLEDSFQQSFCPSKQFSIGQSSAHISTIHSIYFLSFAIQSPTVFISLAKSGQMSSVAASTSSFAPPAVQSFL